MSKSSLTATVVVDYQNVHLTAAGLFRPHQAKHHCLIQPLRYALEVIRMRNLKQRTGYPPATLDQVLVYRGLPSAEHSPSGYRRNLSQASEWRRDPRVLVTQRPLKYVYRHVSGQREVIDVREKGVDVLCALALVREARKADTDLVILASQDTDLEPAIEEVQSSAFAKCETASWFDRDQPGRSRELRLPGIWNTRLDALSFQASLDRHQYR